MRSSSVLLQSIAYLLFDETNLPVKKSHITLIMTSVPDGARGNHFGNKKQDSICIEIISAVSSPSPRVSIVVRLNGLLMIPLHYMGFSLKYATMTSPCLNDAQLATSLTQCPGK